MPPSRSEAVALQVNVELVVTPVAGLTLMLSTVGSVFSMVTDAVSSSVPPSRSLAVAVQVISSVGETVEGVRARVGPLPRMAPDVRVHSYDSDGVPPSASVAVALQVSELDVVTPVLGVMEMVSTTGGVFSTVTSALWDTLPL